MLIASAQKIMLYTDTKSASVLNRACGCARYAYNWALDTWLEKKRSGQKTVTCNELRKEFNARKTDWMYESPKGSMDQAIKNFCIAKKHHYENPKQFGFPKRKKHSSRRSFYIENDKAKLIDAKHIKLPLVKNPIEMAEPVCNACINGKINNFVISLGSNGQWYVSISYSYDDTDMDNHTTGNGVVGIDLGIKTLMQLSDGNAVGNAAPLKKLGGSLRRYQKKMSRRRKGSSRYNRAKTAYRKLHARIANIRSDCLHKATTEIIRKNMVVATEDLNMKGMMHNRRLAAAIADCGFGMINRMFEYKCKKFGTLLLKVDRFFPSSKMCSGCGHVKENLSLSEREFICENCGIALDRDYNAAVNILAEALFAELNVRFNTDVARRKFTPAEIVALAGRSVPYSETTVGDAQCRSTRSCRMTLVDEFFSRLRNHVELSTVNCYI